MNASWEGSPLPAGSRPELPLGLVVAATLLFLYALLFTWPFVPLASGFDGSILVTDGLRLSRGELPYRDFFEFLTPGTALIFALLIKALGTRLWIPVTTLLLVNAAVAVTGVMIARKMMRPSLAILVGAIFLEGVCKNLLNPTHHWFSMLAANLSILVLIERRTLARIAAAGAFAGLAACITQARGVAVAAGLMVFLWWESRQRKETGDELRGKLFSLGAGFVAVVLGVNAYFIWKAGLYRFLWCTVWYGVKYFPQQSDDNTFRVLAWSLSSSLGHSPGDFAHWVLIHAVLPSVPLIFVVRYWRRSDQKPLEFWRRPMLVAIVGLSMLASVAPSPSPPRMASSAMPGLILLGWLLDSPRQLARGIAAVLAVGILLGVPYSAFRAQKAPKTIVTDPLGEFASASPGEAEEYRWIVQHTRPGEFFFAALDPNVYFYLGLRNPSPLPFLTNNGYTTTQQVAEVIRGLEQHQPQYIFWPHQDREGIPAWENPSDDHLGPLRDYRRVHYRVVKTFDNYDEIWERSD
jgi:hypothetical protein